MSELFHECGVAAVYHQVGDEVSPLCPMGDPQQVSRLIPRMLLDIQNRGQLSAGFTTYQAGRSQLLSTYKEVGTVQEVFRLSHPGKSESLMKQHMGNAAIGHVRYATCGKDDVNFAQPFERPNLRKNQWFAFAFNGQLANYAVLRDELLAGGESHLAREADTELIMHEIGRLLAAGGRGGLVEMLAGLCSRLDGAYSMAYLNGAGELLVARDPLGNRPMCYARRGPLVAAASESVALSNLGFHRDEVHSLPPGHALIVSDGNVSIDRFAPPARPAHCFFEWIYFANVASNLDGRSVYLARTALGRELADLEKAEPLFDCNDGNTIVVPVPDTSKAAADAMAFRLGIPSLEGLIRNRYTGRTFIEQQQAAREERVRAKYTPLPEVIEGKRVILVEDSIVRSTTLKALLKRVYAEGGAREVHVRVACPPIIAPCFYGIDMSTVGELFAPRFLVDDELTRQGQEQMALELGCDSLRYLPVWAVAKAIGLDSNQLCRACITGQYPTPHGQHLYQVARSNAARAPADATRTYELPSVPTLAES
jgi:amidophosphoribosyltransferase